MILIKMAVLLFFGGFAALGWGAFFVNLWYAVEDVLFYRKNWHYNPAEHLFTAFAGLTIACFASGVWWEALHWALK